mmetsp:Transcript_47259/g.143101  ORF Transcript_47259/g.143101 Transcript_47259/m.143101 type:complete len:253 (+) Transcript_47259:704-1462(+)
MRSTNDEAARGVKVVDGLVIKVLSGDDRLDDVLHEVRGDLLVSDLLRVLSGDDDGVNTCRGGYTVLELVFAGDLGLAIRTDPVAGAVLAHLSELGAQGGGELVSERHERLSLIGGISKHDTLVTSANVLNLDRINRLGNIRGLLLDSNDHIAGLVIETLRGIIVSNVADSITDDLLVIDSGLGGDLTKDHHHASLAASFASDTAGLIASNAGIKNRIRHLIAEFIRVALVHGLGSEKEGRHDVGSVRHKGWC